MLVELHDAQGELYHAGRVVKENHAARAQEFAALAERIKVHVHLLSFVGGENEGGRSPGNHSFEFASVGNAAAHVIDHLLERIAERKLIDAGLVDVSAQTEE